LRPNFTPRAFAAFTPARVRSVIRLRSSSAKTPIICNMARPAKGRRCLFDRYAHLDIAARCSGVYRCCNSSDVQSNNRPLRSAQHHKSNSAASEILLVAHAFVSGKKHVETRAFRLDQQVAIGQRIPSSVFGLCDSVAGKEPGNAARRYMVKENEHPQGNLRQEQGPDQGCGRQIQVPR